MGRLILDGWLGSRYYSGSYYLYPHDLIIEIVARDVDELQQLVMDRIRALDNVVRTNTILLLFSVKDELSYIP